MFPDRCYTDADIRKRFALNYGEDAAFEDEWINKYRKKWSSLGKFMQEVKQIFSRYYILHLEDDIVYSYFTVSCQLVIWPP